MSVLVRDLTKFYGTQKAIDGVTFHVVPGEILGFLGPNGAGKTTTMKIITGFLRADRGTAEVNGFDVAEQPLEVKKQIGYLPEHNPLYIELYVREYLSFVCRLYGIAGIRERIATVIGMTGLEREAHKKIGALSKGYRQRVGLAQALIHDPPVLILDEPTSGLDPNQIAEIRALIRSLGKNKTVIFSTHIMQEVQSVCDRVIILDQGRIVIDRPIGFLMEAASDIRYAVVVRFDRRIMQNTLATLPEISSVTELPDATYRVIGSQGADIRPVLFQFAVDKGTGIIEMYTEKSTVEDVFRKLTRKKEDAV